MSHGRRRQLRLPPKECSSCHRSFSGYYKRLHGTPVFYEITRSKMPTHCTNCYPDILKGAWKKLNRL